MCGFRVHCPISTGGFRFRAREIPHAPPLAPFLSLPALFYPLRLVNTTKNHTRPRPVRIGRRSRADGFGRGNLAPPLQGLLTGFETRRQGDRIGNRSGIGSGRQGNPPTDRGDRATRQRFGATVTRQRIGAATVRGSDGSGTGSGDGHAVPCAVRIGRGNRGDRIGERSRRRRIGAATVRHTRRQGDRIGTARPVKQSVLTTPTPSRANMGQPLRGSTFAARAADGFGQNETPRPHTGTRRTGSDIPALPSVYAAADSPAPVACGGSCAADGFGQGNAATVTTADGFAAPCK